MGERTKDGTGQPEPMVSTLIGAESAEHCEWLPPLAFRLGSIVPAHKQSTLRCFKNSLGLIYFWWLFFSSFPSAFCKSILFLTAFPGAPGHQNSILKDCTHIHKLNFRLSTERPVVDENKKLLIENTFWEVWDGNKSFCSAPQRFFPPMFSSLGVLSFLPIPGSTAALNFHKSC
jgi:hypothetical protein